MNSLSLDEDCVLGTPEHIDSEFRTLVPSFIKTKSGCLFPAYIHLFVEYWFLCLHHQRSNLFHF